MLQILFILISFSAGITSFLWNQLAAAIALGIIIPVVLLYFLISRRYRSDEPKSPKKKKRQNAVDNYFNPVEK